MPKYIDADALMEDLRIVKPITETEAVAFRFAYLKLKDAPTADVVEVKHGKWTDKQVIHAEEAKEVIEEWQSCRCSICDHYNTQPYMYYFSEPNYCSFCGADMRERGEDETD